MAEESTARLKFSNYVDTCQEAVRCSFFPEARKDEDRHGCIAEGMERVVADGFIAQLPGSKSVHIT
jgi:hypothetical protein